MAYHYQCAGCYCTLYLDGDQEKEVVYSIVNGELCSSCKAKREQKNYDDYDDD